MVHGTASAHAGFHLNSSLSGTAASEPPFLHMTAICASHMQMFFSAISKHNQGVCLLYIHTGLDEYFCPIKQ